VGLGMWRGIGEEEKEKEGCSIRSDEMRGVSSRDIY